MASFVASGLATAPARVFALASAPRAHEARNAALATTHRRRVRAVPSSTARWTAAPARGDGADERARTRLRVLYEPSSAECTTTACPSFEASGYPEDTTKLPLADVELDGYVVTFHGSTALAGVQ